MPSTEPQAVDARLTRAAIFLVVTLNPGADHDVAVRGLCADLSSLVRGVGFRSQDFIHGMIERGFELSIGLCRYKVRVRAKHAVEIADLKLFSKDINCVCAIQAKGGLFQQSIPQLFQPDRGGELPRLP